MDGQAISWSYKTIYNGDHITAVFNGHFGADGKITGTLTVPEYDSEGTFTAFRAPAAPAQ